jgi:hypothetical protein
LACPTNLTPPSSSVLLILLCVSCGRAHPDAVSAGLVVQPRRLRLPQRELPGAVPLRIDERHRAKRVYGQRHMYGVQLSKRTHAVLSRRWVGVALLLLYLMFQWRHGHRGDHRRRHHHHHHHNCDDCVPCVAGSVNDTVCPAGFWCANSTTATPCTLGTFCGAGEAVWQACPAGFYCPHPSTKLRCPVDHVCPEGSIAPVSCPRLALCAGYLCAFVSP